jgi:two-component sensor histidine kinase
VSLPIILMTGQDDAETELLAASAGASDYLPKQQLSAPLLRRAIRYALARQRSVQDLQRSARDKAVLLREIHHRVKNNLQVISSLLRLQVSSSTDDTTRAMFTDCENRVRAMALLHENLYQSADLSHTNVARYIGALMTAIVAANDSAGVAVEVRCDEVSLTIDAAMPLGLIVNELVTNALKHAFLGRSSGARIEVTLTRDAQDGLALTVSDNGPGHAEGSDSDNKTLGALLVRALSRQMGGTIQRLAMPGTAYRLAFRP